MIGILGYGYIGSRLHGEKITQNQVGECDKVYYLAAQSQPGLKWTDYLPNIVLTTDVVQKCKGELVFTSTIKIFDSYKQVNPVENYEVSKKINEDIIVQAGKSGLKYQILRLANVISPDVKYGIFYELVEQAKNGLIKYYPGAYRPFITLDQAVKAIEMEKPPGIYTVSCGAIYIEDIIKMLASKFQFKTQKLKGEPLMLEPGWNKMRDLGWDGRNSKENIEEVLCSL